MTTLGWRQCIQPLIGIELVELLFDQANQHRVILLGHLRLNPITRLDFSHLLGSIIFMQTYFLPVLHVTHRVSANISDLASPCPCLATTRLDEFLKSLQISLHAQRHHSQGISYILDNPLRVIL